MWVWAVTPFCLGPAHPGGAGGFTSCRVVSVSVLAVARALLVNSPVLLLDKADTWMPSLPAR